MSFGLSSPSSPTASYVNRTPILVCAFWVLATTSLVRASDSVEEQLAVIEENGPVRDSDIRIARFRSLLNQLATTFPNTKQSIADMTVTARERLKKEGVEESLLKIMEGMNQIFTERSQHQYSEVLAAYIVLRVKGTSHDDAIGALKEFMGALGR